MICYGIFYFRGVSCLNRSVTILLLTALILCGCTQVTEEPVYTTAPTETERIESPYPVTVGSLIFSEQPRTVGSLSPALTEIICELGYSDKMIGISSYCDHPENILDRISLGSAANPDAGAIIAAAPQLLVSQSPIAKKDITAIEEAGTRVMITPAPDSVEELYSCYIDIASVFGGSLSCTEAADNAMKPLTDALHQAEGSIGSFVYIMSPDLAAASDATFAGNFFSHFGSNAAGGEEDIFLTPEKLSALDPEWLIIPSFMADDIPDEISSLDAYRSGRVIILDDDMLERIERPTSRLSGTVREILEQIGQIGSGSIGTDENDRSDDTDEVTEE